jgi:hypothetical protein
MVGNVDFEEELLVHSDRFLALASQTVLRLGRMNWTN